MEARVKVFGHPVHQMLVVLPLGSLTAAVLFDLCHVFSGGEQWALVSFWTIALGVASGLLAAVFGFADWTKIPPGTRAKRIGAMHGIGDVIVVALFAASWLLRGGEPADPGTLALVLSLAGGGLSMLTGWLGGERVDRLGVGVGDGAHLDAPGSLSGRPAGGPVHAAR